MTARTLMQDTGGSYCYEFPSMVGVSLFSADAVVLVFSLADQDSFEELVRLRELVRQAKSESWSMIRTLLRSLSGSGSLSDRQKASTSL